MKLLNITVRNIVGLIVILALAAVMIQLVRGQTQTPLTTQAVTATNTPKPANTPPPTETNTPSLSSPTPFSPPLTPIRTTPYLSFAATPEPGPTYTPTPVEIEMAAIEPLAVTVISDEPLLSSEILSTISLAEYSSVSVEGWPSINELVLRVGNPPDDSIWTISQEQMQIEQISDETLTKSSERLTRVREQVHQFLSPDEQVDYGNFSPDGELVVWGHRQSIEYETLQVKRLNIDEPPITLMGDKKYERYYGHLWAPDSTKIAYIVDNGNVHFLEVYIRDLAGQRIGMIPVLNGDMAWSPDGQYLAFEMAEEQQSGIINIFLVRQDGSGLTKLTHHGLAGGHLHWSPAGNAITYSYRQENGYSTPWLVTIAK